MGSTNLLYLAFYRVFAWPRLWNWLHFSLHSYRFPLGALRSSFVNDASLQMVFAGAWLTYVRWGGSVLAGKLPVRISLRRDAVWPPSPERFFWPDFLAHWIHLFRSGYIVQETHEFVNRFLWIFYKNFSYRKKGRPQGRPALIPSPAISVKRRRSHWR